MFIFPADPLVTIFFQLGIALVLGAVVGVERVVAGKVAGLRTFSLISLASCLLVVIGELVVATYMPTKAGASLNPLFLAGALVTGMGFLGAGLIIFRDSTLSGLTTAAGMWITSIIGITVGFGYYAIALFSTLLTLFIFTGLWFVEQKIKEISRGEMSSE